MHLAAVIWHFWIGLVFFWLFMLAVTVGIGTIMALLYGSGVLNGGDVGTLIVIIVLFVVTAVILGLIVGPIVFGSTYASYKDTFPVDAEVAANPAYR